MEPKSSLSLSQKPANGPYPEPDESTSRLPTLFILLRAALISPIHATCPAHLIFPDLITLTIFREEYKLWNKESRETE
jgi:hypothetical protein